MKFIIISIIFWFLVFAFCGLDVRRIINRLSSTKEVDAEVINKECFSDFVRGRIATLSSQPREHYIVTFMCNNKKRKFNVSGNAYDNYHVGDYGRLKYCGDIILTFNKF